MRSKRLLCYKNVGRRRGKRKMYRPFEKARGKGEREDQTRDERNETKLRLSRLLLLLTVSNREAGKVRGPVVDPEGKKEGGRGSVQCSRVGRKRERGRDSLESVWSSSPDSRRRLFRVVPTTRSAPNLAVSTPSPSVQATRSTALASSCSEESQLRVEEGHVQPVSDLIEVRNRGRRRSSEVLLLLLLLLLLVLMEELLLLLLERLLLSGNGSSVRWMMREGELTVLIHRRRRGARHRTWLLMLLLRGLSLLL